MTPEQRQKLILDMITLTGPVTAHTVAEALGLELKTVVASCVNLKKTGHLHSAEEEPERRPPRLLWSVTPPIVRYRPFNRVVGIDEDDIAWMERYKKQAAERQQRRAVT